MAVSQKKNEWSWALYDWANSAFATTVIAGLFPAYFSDIRRAVQVSVVEGEATAEQLAHFAARSTSELGFANTLASIAVAVMAPIIGAIADRGGAKKRFLFAFTTLGVLMTGMLAIAGPTTWLLALIVFIAASIGFNGGLVFYDALLVDVTTEDRFDFVSALGFAVGYLGGGLLLALNVFMVMRPEVFGLRDAAQAVQISFIMVAVWWAVFSLPLFLFVEEKKRAHVLPLASAAKAGIKQLVETFNHLRRLRAVFLFVLAYILYIDGVNTVIRMAVAFGKDLGFETTTLITALLLTQFVAFPAALAFGKIGQHLGPKTGILIAIGVYILATLGATQMRESWHFFALAVTVGLVQGGIQSLSRSMFARLIPKDKAGEFFGFYNMMGKASAIFGPSLMAIGAMLSPEPRYSILALLVLFVGGGTVLLFVDEEHKSLEARQT